MKQDLHSLSRYWFDQVWNNLNENVIDQLCSPDAVIHGLGEEGRVVRGPAGFREFFNLFNRSFSNIHVDVQDVLVEGDKSAVRIVATMKHTGDGLGIPPSQRQVRTSGMMLLRWNEGRVHEAWNEFDAAGMMAQITGPATAQLRA